MGGLPPAHSCLHHRSNPKPLPGSPPFHPPGASPSIDLSAIHFHHFSPLVKTHFCCIKSELSISYKVLCTLALPNVVFPGLPPAHLLQLGIASLSCAAGCSASPAPLLPCPAASSRGPGLAPSDSCLQVHLGRTVLPADLADSALTEFSLICSSCFLRATDDCFTVWSLLISPSGL